MENCFSNNENSTTRNDFQPISLLPNLGKVYEEIIKQRSENGLERINFSHNNNSDYRVTEAAKKAANAVLQHIAS